MYTWYIPDGYVPGRGEGIASHEALCILNPNPREARVLVDVYFINRDPIRDVALTVGAERSSRISLGVTYPLEGLQVIDIPLDTPFSLRVRSEERVYIQYTRVDTRQPNLALMSVLVGLADQ